MTSGVPREGNNGNVPTHIPLQFTHTTTTNTNSAAEVDAQPFVEHAASGPSCKEHCSEQGLRESEEDLVRVLKVLLEKEAQQNKDDQIRREWRMLAEIIDKWLFWSFFLITSLSTAIFIVILPYGKRGKFF